jgi:hypothetical protein
MRLLREVEVEFRVEFGVEIWCRMESRSLVQLVEAILRARVVIRGEKALDEDMDSELTEYLTSL